MAYKISARHPGRAVTYTADTEEAALAKWDELTADGVPFEMTDADGVVVDDLDLEERIDARGDGEPPPAS
jgi:ketosteroid isomerase-like protein